MTESSTRKGLVMYDRGQYREGSVRYDRGQYKAGVSDV